MAGDSPKRPQHSLKRLQVRAKMASRLSQADCRGANRIVKYDIKCTFHQVDVHDYVFRHVDVILSLCAVYHIFYDKKYTSNKSHHSPLEAPL